MPQITQRLASRVTVGVGAGIPRVFKDVWVAVHRDCGLVEMWSGEDASLHLATAPTTATLIEWQVSPRPQHKILMHAGGVSAHTTGGASFVNARV